MNTAKPKANSNSTCYWSGEGEDVGGNMLETVDKWGVKGVEDKHAAYLSLREVSVGWLGMRPQDGRLRGVADTCIFFIVRGRAEI